MNNEFRDLTNAVMKRKSVSWYEAQVIAARLFIKDIKPGSDEFEEEMQDVKTLWRD